MVKQWLAERWTELLPQLAPLGLAQEEEVKRICEEEIAAWEARPSMKKKSSLRVPMTDTRNWIKEVIPMTAENRWYDEKNREWVPVALKYMAYSEQDYIEMNAPSEEVLQRRLKQQQVLDEPHAIVKKAEELLQHERFEDLVVGLAVVTGRRLTEIMKTAAFRRKTAYSVRFDGQLKRKDVRLAPYEIPTLVRADLVMDAWKRLRAQVDCTRLTNAQVAEKYSRVISENVNRHVASLIATTVGRDGLHTHQLRAVYAAIAVYYYLPERVAEITYMATIDGHYKLLETPDEQMQLNFASTAHYLDYRVADERRGIKLGEPGVEVLETFKPQGEEEMVRKAKAKQETEATGVVVEARNKTGWTIVKVKEGTKNITDALMTRRGKHNGDEIVVDLIDHDAIAHQLSALLEPLAEELGTKADAPVATLQALLAAYKSGARSKEAGEDQQAEALAVLAHEIEGEGEQPVAYLRKLVDRDKKYKEGISNRFAGTEYTKLPWPELVKIKTGDAALERYRRAVDAILLHNAAQSDPLHRWYVNAAAVRELTGGRNEAVQDYLLTRGPELDEHHAFYQLTARDNRKPIKITSEVDVADLSPGYSLDGSPTALEAEVKEGEPAAQA